MILQEQHHGRRIDFCWESLIELYKEVLLWQPFGHHSHFEGWDGFGMVFDMQFDITINIHFLNRAIHCGLMACNMLNPRHPRAFRYSSNLSIALKSRYDALGNLADLELALSHARLALDLGPPDRRPKLMRDLANIMISVAGHSGNVEVLSEATCLARKAFGSLYEPEKFMALETLVTSLIMKALHFGDIDDLEECIHHIRQRLECTCIDEETTLYMYGAVNASEALLQYYEMDPTRHQHALTEAITLLETVTGRNTPEVYRAHVLHWTARAYRAQFYHSGVPDMLKSAFAIDQQALDLRPPGHPLRCMSLAALSDDLVGLTVIGESIDLENAIGVLKVAFKDLEEGHPDRLKVSVSMAKLLLIPNTPYTDCEEALSLLFSILQNPPGSAYRCVVDIIPVLRSLEINVSPKWMADDPTRQQCLNVYQALIDILPRLASLDLDLGRRIQVLFQARDLATKAASHAMTLKQSHRAVELLESGRAVFWAQHLRLRTSFDSLDSDTAKELRDIGRRLEVTTGLNIPPDLDINLARARMERVMTERRLLSARFEELVDQVRSQPGMDGFLRSMNYKALCSAATRGPVVILQPSWMCVIITPHDDPQIIPLREVTKKWLQDVTSAIRLAACTSRNRLDDRGAKKRPADEAASWTSDEYNILADIWHRIIQPLLGFLGWEVSLRLLYQ
jgi:hypothetical protein